MTEEQSRKQQVKARLSYWVWFFDRRQQYPGFKVVLTRWATICIVAGIATALMVDKPYGSVSAAMIFPLAGVLVGLTFGWSANAQAILQSPEVYGIFDDPESEVKRIINYYQTAILIVLITIAAWGFASLEVVVRLPAGLSSLYFAGEATLYSLFYYSFIECWFALNLSRELMLTRIIILTAGPKSPKKTETGTRLESNTTGDTTGNLVPPAHQADAQAAKNGGNEVGQPSGTCEQERVNQTTS